MLRSAHLSIGAKIVAADFGPVVAGQLGKQCGSDGAE